MRGTDRDRAGEALPDQSSTSKPDASAVGPTSSFFGWRGGAGAMILPAVELFKVKDITAMPRSLSRAKAGSAIHEHQYPSPDGRPVRLSPREVYRGPEGIWIGPPRVAHEASEQGVEQTAGRGAASSTADAFQLGKHAR
ncbi:MAG TPA: hypothetical protein VKT99_06045 [Xanthobacteraceae bacterium]|nr:hypothetical protein [Xanthobacteraceae bacterium]